MRYMLAATAAAVAALTVPAAAQQAGPPSPSAPYGAPGAAYPPPAPAYPAAPAIMWLPGAYLRADGGYGFTTGTDFRDVNFDTTLGPGVRINGDSGNSPFYDAGVGFRFNRWFRADVTASYMPSLKFSGTDNIGDGSVNKAGERSESAFLTGYFDLPALLTVFGPFVQPYFDFGVGAARNHVGAFSSTFPGINGTIEPHTESSAAVSAGLGVAISLGRNSALDLSYRFMDLGQLRTGSTVDSGGMQTAIQPIKAELYANVLTAGVRFAF
jgi:opacity protein-like surface antigen